MAIIEAKKTVELSKRSPAEVTIGVLAVQGSFNEHIVALERLNDVAYSSRLQNTDSLHKNMKIKVTEIRSSKDICPNMKGLIIPGGESTTLNIFLEDNGFHESIQQWIRCEGNVVWGTCAGMILLSNSIVGEKLGGQIKIGGVGVTTQRNYFGRQIQSFESHIELKDPQLAMACNALNGTITKTNQIDEINRFNGIFIRAPGIVSIDDQEQVKVLATLDNDSAKLEDSIVAARQGNIMITSFHPELTDDLRFHKYFVDMIINAQVLIMSSNTRNATCVTN